MRLTELASDLEALRTDIADELLAINRYEQQTFTLREIATSGDAAPSSIAHRWPMPDLARLSMSALWSS